MTPMVHVRANNMQKVPRKKIRGEVADVPKGIWKAPQPTMRMVFVSVQVKVKPPPVVKHAEGVWEAASLGSNAWRATSPTRTLIRNSDAANLILLRVPSGRRPNGKEVTLSSMISNAPPSQPDCGKDKKVQEAIFEILHMNG